jgi:hypothetical protein
MHYLLIFFFVALGIGKVLGLCCLLAIINCHDLSFAPSDRRTAWFLAFWAIVWASIDFIVAASIFLND